MLEYLGEDNILTLNRRIHKIAIARHSLLLNDHSWASLFSLFFNYNFFHEENIVQLLLEIFLLKGGHFNIYNEHLLDSLNH